MKFLLCRPQAGLNDLLNQVERCCQYAEQTGRTLIIDTNYKNASTFSQKFSDYFESKQKKLFLDVEQHQEILNRLEIFPNALTGRVFDYQTSFIDGYYHDRETKVPITFDFTKDYDEPLLIHHQCGGGANAHMTFLRLQLKGLMIDKLISRILTIDQGGNYQSTHIRNTGLTTPYLELLPSLKNTFGNSKIFVASDDVHVIHDFRNFFGPERIFSFSHLPNDFPVTKDADGLEHIGLEHHKSLSSSERNQRNEDAILDLLTASYAKRFYPLPLDDKHKSFGYTQPKFSGFTVLANNLFTWKVILKSLTSNRILTGLE